MKASLGRRRSNTLGIALRFQQRVVESGQEHLADELVHQLAAAAVGEEDLRVVLDGQWTGGCEVGGCGLRFFGLCRRGIGFAAVAVVGGTGALGGDHCCAEWMFLGAARPEGGAFVGLDFPL